MKKIYAYLAYLMIAVGFILFVLRGFVNTVSPDEPFARDLLGFPLLEPGYFDVPGDILIKFFIGGAIPYVLIGLGYWLINKTKKGNKNEKSF